MTATCSLAGCELHTYRAVGPLSYRCAVAGCEAVRQDRSVVCVKHQDLARQKANP